VLPVSRYDIADYLAVSVETVCRALTDLRAAGRHSLGGQTEDQDSERNALEDRTGESSMVAGV